MVGQGRASQSERQQPNAGKTQRKGCDASPRAKTERLAEPSRRGRRHAKSSSLQFQERGLSPRQFQMRAGAQDSAAQSCLGNGQQAALQELREIERSRGRPNAPHDRSRGLHEPLANSQLIRCPGSGFKSRADHLRASGDPPRSNLSGFLLRYAEFSVCENWSRGWAARRHGRTCDGN
jgi:hypothetical protein